MNKMYNSILVPENLKSVFLLKTKKKEIDFNINSSELMIEALRWYTSTHDGVIGKYSFETKSLWISLKFENSDFIKLHKKGILERIERGVYRFIK